MRARISPTTAAAPAANQLDALGQAEPVEHLQEGLRPRDDVGPLEQGADEIGVGDEEGGKQPAAAAADVGHAGGLRGRLQNLDDRPGLVEGLAGQIGLEQRAVLAVQRPPIRNAHAEDMPEGRRAGLEVRGEIGPGLPILFDHDADFLGEARRGAGAQRLAGRGERETAIKFLANADGAQPAKETVEMRRRQPERRGKLLGRRGRRRQPVGKPERHRGIDQCRLVIGLDLAAQPVLEGLLVCHGCGSARWFFTDIYSIRIAGRSAGESLPRQRRCYNHLP
jgi:hypothetical protein